MRIKTLTAVMVLFILLAHITVVTDSVRSALNICAVSIVPSLLVFFVMSDMIVTAMLSEPENRVSTKWTAFLLGTLCGFPVGANICNSLYEKKAICEKDAQRLMPFCNNTSPAFVIGAIGTAALGDVRLGILLFCAEVTAALVLMLPIRCESCSVKTLGQKIKIADIFFRSIEKSIESILKICGIICVFSAVLAVLKQYCGELGYIILSAIFEISNGAINASSLYSAKPTFSIALCGFICGWSGLCVHLQILSSLKSIKVKVHSLLLSKALQGLLTSVFALIGYKLFFGS